MENIVLVIASGFGLGLLPWGPGTFGALLGLPLAWWLMGRRLPLQIGITIVLLLMAVPICHEASRLLGGGDAPSIVADEFLALPIAMLGLGLMRTPLVIGAAFLLFRFFDITKLPPTQQLEAIGGGLGIVLDDVMAAVYAGLTLFAFIKVWRRY